jgi:peptidoglycan/LPS O-acetylase OafA/YrhL
MTLLGYNLSANIQHIDYTRWYVTFLLMWYLLFYLGVSRLSKHKCVVFLFLGATILFPIHYYFLSFNWYQFFAFPIGCVCGVFYEDLKKRYIANESVIVIAAFMGAIYVMFYKIWISHEAVLAYLLENVPNILLSFLYQMNSLIFSFSIIVAVAYFGRRNYRSRFLALCGKYSYELFLIHGAFLIKYNSFIHGGGMLPVLAGFFLLLVFLFLVASGISRLNSALYEVPVGK